MELLLLPDGQYGGILNMSTESATENLILSMGNLHSSWSKEPPQIISQNNNWLYSIIGLNLVVFITIIGVYKKFKIKSIKFMKLY